MSKKASDLLFGTKNEELMLRFEVTSYPTLKFFLKENEIDYLGNT